jgi:phage protein D
MVKKPCFKLMSDNKDITEHIAKSLISVSYEDKINEESDEIVIVLSGLFEKKPFGSNLKLWLGYEDRLYLCGSFFLQTIEKDYMLKTTEIRATAMNFAGSQKENKSRLWEDTSLEDLASKIANENKLSLKVYGKAKEIFIESEEQRDMNDIDFLWRISKKNDFFGVLKNNTIYIYKKNDLQPNSDKNLLNGDFTLKLSELSSLVITENNRNVYDAVVLEWHNSDSGENETVRIGKNGDQIYKARVPEPKSKTEIIRYGEAKLKELRKSGIFGQLRTDGQEIRSGASLTIDVLPNAIFSIKSVLHMFDSDGYSISLDFEL